MSLQRDLILYPDDLGHAYALLRAWDRFLVSQELLPLFTSDLSKVGPILVNPNGSHEYYEYYIDPNGILRTILQEENMQQET